MAVVSAALGLTMLVAALSRPQPRHGFVYDDA